MNHMNANMLETRALAGNGELGRHRHQGEAELGAYEEILGDYSELGLEEILGDDGMNSMPTREKTLRRVSDGPWKIKLIGFRSPLAVAAGATESTEIRPSQDFKIARVMFASEIAPFFGISSVIVGPEQMLLTGEVPASTLSEAALGAALRFRTINVGVPLQLSAVNRDAAAQFLKFTLIGIAM